MSTKKDLELASQEHPNINEAVVKLKADLDALHPDWRSSDPAISETAANIGAIALLVSGGSVLVCLAALLRTLDIALEGSVKGALDHPKTCKADAEGRICGLEKYSFRAHLADDLAQAPVVMDMQIERRGPDTELPKDSFLGALTKPDSGLLN